MEFKLNIRSEFEETNCSSSQIHTVSPDFNDEAYIEEGNPLIITDNDPPQQTISQQTSEIGIQGDKNESYHQCSIEKMTITPETIIKSNSQCVTSQKLRIRSRKICCKCSKSVFDLRRHLQHCHKKLDHLQIVKIIAESKRFRKDLKKKPTKAIRNVLLCPYSNEKGEICDRPIVEYKLYQHLKFYHNIHPKSAEGIRLVKYARANPFAVKSLFPESSGNRLNSIDDSSSSSNLSKSASDYDTDQFEVRNSFPNKATSSNLPIHSETNITQSQIITHSFPHLLLTPHSYSSQIQPQPIISSPPDIPCSVVSICLNIAVSCNNIVPIDTLVSINANIEDTL